MRPPAPWTPRPSARSRRPSTSSPRAARRSRSPTACRRSATRTRSSCSTTAASWSAARTRSCSRAADAMRRSWSGTRSLWRLSRGSGEQLAAVRLDRRLHCLDGGKASGVAGVRPGRVGPDAVAAFRLRPAHRDQVEAVGPRFEGAHDFGGHPYDVPLADVLHFVVEPNAAGAADHDVGLLLLTVTVTLRAACAGCVSEVAHAEVSGAEVLATEAPFEAGHPSLNGVLDLEQVHDGVVDHGSSLERRRRGLRRPRSDRRPGRAASPPRPRGPSAAPRSRASRAAAWWPEPPRRRRGRRPRHSPWTAWWSR